MNVVVQECIDLIKHFEGLCLKPYVCPSGKLTIGYGHTEGVDKRYSITKEEAEILLRNDLDKAANVVRKYVKVPLNDNQFSALVSFVFNVGEDNFRKSTLLKLLNEGKYGDVPNQLLRWNRSSKKGKSVVLEGLTKRRKAEVELWNKPIGDSS